MEYAELNLYNKYGGERKKTEKKDENNIEKILNEKKQKNKEENLIKLYKKKIIEQRNEIERLKELLEKYKK